MDLVATLASAISAGEVTPVTRAIVCPTTLARMEVLVLMISTMGLLVSVPLDGQAHFARTLSAQLIVATELVKLVKHAPVAQTIAASAVIVPTTPSCTFGMVLQHLSFSF